MNERHLVAVAPVCFLIKGLNKRLRKGPALKTLRSRACE
jgi:hypothetical protein